MKIFVGSTFEDLKRHREQAIKGLRGLAVRVEAMELWFAMPEEPIAACLKRVRESDVYVCIVAYRYGSETELGKSYTQCEYEAAREASKDCLVFIMADGYPIPPRCVDTGVPREKLEKFKQTLWKNHLCASFSSPEDLAYRIVESVRGVMEAKGLRGAATLSLDQFWKEMESTWERLEPADLRAEFDPKFSALDLIGVLQNQVEGIQGFHTHISRSYSLLESDLKAVLGRIGVDPARMESIPYYENPFVNRDWEWVTLFPNRITACNLALAHLRVKYLEDLSGTQGWTSKLERTLADAKQALEEILKTASYID